MGWDCKREFWHEALQQGAVLRDVRTPSAERGNRREGGTEIGREERGGGVGRTEGSHYHDSRG
jgi:hypothetical protein